MRALMAGALSRPGCCPARRLLRQRLPSVSFATTTAPQPRGRHLPSLLAASARPPLRRFASSVDAAAPAAAASPAVAAWHLDARPVCAAAVGVSASALSLRNVVLIGSPGSGKSAVARALSSLLSLPCVDVDDDVLEPAWGCSVADKLRELGDAAFLREEERLVLGLRLQRCVISASGSVPLSPLGMRHLAQSSVVVYLDCAPAVVLSRCATMKLDRIVGQSTRKLPDILSHRAAVYEAAYDLRMTVHAAQSPLDIAAAIAQRLQQTGEFTSTRGYDRRRGGEGRLGEELMEVVRGGLAPDGGLFVPAAASAPHRLSLPDIGRLAPLSYAEQALRVMERLPLGRLHPSHLRALLTAAYSSFSHPAVLPVSELTDGLLLMETYHGPTASFKDLSLQLLPRLLQAALSVTQTGAGAAASSSSPSAAPARARVALLVATSGDTGTAALDGFSRAAGMPVVVLYPAKGVSEVQRAQMQTASGDVLVLAVDGDFDFCQSTVKSMFSDSGLKAELAAAWPGLQLSSANSINWGRFLPQVVFTVASYAQLVQAGRIRLGDEVDVCIPTGNFGNLLGALYARRLGLPLRRLVSASNSNNVISDFISSGVYDLRQRAFTATVSPSIDILLSSNLERFLFLLTDGDSEQVLRLFSQLSSTGCFSLTPELLRRVQAEVQAGWCSEAQCLQTIRDVHRSTGGRLIDPHTAVAVHVARQHAQPSTPMLVSSTAHYGKFPSTMLSALQLQPEAGAAGELSSLFRALRSVSPLSPDSPMHPALSALVTAARLQTAVVPATREAVVSAVTAFFTQLGARDRQRERDGGRHGREELTQAEGQRQTQQAASQ